MKRFLLVFGLLGMLALAVYPAQKHMSTGKASPVAPASPVPTARVAVAGPESEVTAAPQLQADPSLWSQPTRSPGPVLAIGPGRTPTRLGLALREVLLERGRTASLAEPGQPADLYVGYDPPGEFYSWPLTRTHFVPVVSFWLPVTEVTYIDLERIFRGEVREWSALGVPSPEKIVPLALQVEPPAPLGPADDVFLADVDALVDALGLSPGGIALVPREQVDVRLRVLQVDGRDPLLDECPAGDPLVRQLSLAWSPLVPAGVVAQVAAVAREQELSPAPPMIELVFVGDVVPGRAVERAILQHGGDYTRPFARVAPWLRRADLTIANLEGALSNQISPPSDPTTFLFIGSGQFCEGLLHAGIDAVSLANNHSMNFGRQGLSHTLGLLEAAGIVPFGAGMDLGMARQPAMFEVQGITFALLGFDGVSHELYGAQDGRAGTAPAFPEIVAADIAAVRDRADVVIPYFHWGWEYTSNPSPWQEQLAHQAVEAGADVVLGTHPHWVQGLEGYQGRTILYSLGNFVFDQMWSIETRRGVIAHLVFQGDRLVNLRFQAVQIEDYHQPVLLPAAEAEEVYRQMQAASQYWPDDQKGAE